MDEHPGPPLNQVARGAVVGLFRASKNQNHMFSFAGTILVRLGNSTEHGTHCQQKGNLSTG